MRSFRIRTSRKVIGASSELSAASVPLPASPCVRSVLQPHKPAPLNYVYAQKSLLYRHSSARAALFIAPPETRPEF